MKTAPIMESLIEEVVSLFDVVTRVYCLKKCQIDSFETCGFEDSDRAHNWFHKDELDLTVPSNFQMVCDAVVDQVEVKMTAFSSTLAVFEIDGIAYILSFIEVSNGFRVYVELIPLAILHNDLMCVFLQLMVESMPLIRAILYSD